MLANDLQSVFEQLEVVHVRQQRHILALYIWLTVLSLTTCLVLVFG